jgi:hypothetical protein
VHDFFQILGLPPGTRAVDIRRVCRGRCPRPHPDIIDTDGSTSAPVIRLHPGAQGMNRRAAQPDRDVSVNFLRMESVIGRMRGSFFAAPWPAVDPIDLTVTPWQLRAGVPITIDVPVLVPCGACHGRGDVLDETCITCRAAGLVRGTRSMHVRLPEGVRTGTFLDIEVAVASRMPAHVRVRLHIVSAT